MMARKTTVTYYTDSHIPGMPYEHRRDVVTSYADHCDGRSWDALPACEQEEWEEWLDEMHAQDVRVAEMGPYTTEEEHELYDATADVEWCALPGSLRAALDRIEAARSQAVICPPSDPSPGK
jgi:hypothetical protein